MVSDADNKASGSYDDGSFAQELVALGNTLGEYPLGQQRTRACIPDAGSFARTPTSFSRKRKYCEYNVTGKKDLLNFTLRLFA